MNQNSREKRRAWESRGKQLWYWLLLVAVAANVFYLALDVARGHTLTAALNGAAAAAALWSALYWRSECYRVTR